LSNPMVEDAVQALTDSHRPVIYNEYGSPIVAGFRVTEGSDGNARITHTTPQPDLMDPERPSDDELAAARHRMVNAYADTLERYGWTVQRQGPTSRNPYLLAAH